MNTTTKYAKNINKPKTKPKEQENTKEVQKYHYSNITSEFLPNSFYALNCAAIQSSSRLTSTNNLSTYQEKECIYSNPNLTNLNEKDFNYNFNALIQLNTELILEAWTQCNYEKLFQLFKLYLKSFFNGKEKEEIKNLFWNKKITDSIYIYSMKCYEVIEKNMKSYNYSKDYNNENLFETTENFYFVKSRPRYTVKEDTLLFLSKFQTLLTIAGEFIFKDEIEKIKQVYRAIDQQK